jgi:hypothetical protein
VDIPTTYDSLHIPTVLVLLLLLLASVDTASQQQQQQLSPLLFPLSLSLFSPLLPHNKTPQLFFSHTQ